RPVGETSENSEAQMLRRRIQRGDMAGIGSAPRGRKNYEIREHAKSRDWKRATRLCLGQSLFQSQRVSLISTFSKPHSEAASTTHTPALKGIPKRRFAVFWFLQAG